VERFHRFDTGPVDWKPTVQLTPEPRRRAETIPFVVIHSLDYSKDSHPNFANLSTSSKDVYDHSGVYFYSRLRFEPVMLRYSMFCLPSTLRAVQGATPYVRLSIKDFNPWEVSVHSIQPKLWSFTLFRESAEAYSHVTPRASFLFYYLNGNVCWSRTNCLFVTSEMLCQMS